MKWYEKARKIIKLQKIKQAELARRMDVPEGTVSKILHGKLGPDSIDWAVRTAKALDIHASVLMSQDEKTDLLLMQLHKLTDREKDALLQILSTAQKFDIPEKSANDR